MSASIEIIERPLLDHLPAVKAHMEEGGTTDLRFLLATMRDAQGVHDYTVQVGREPIHSTGDLPDFRWHISIAGMHTVPPWNALTAIAHEVRPGVAFCVPCPPRSQWMNYNERVLHLYEVKDPNLMEQWRFEGKGHTPT